MSLLICGFGEKEHQSIIKGLVSQYGSEQTVLISPINHEDVPTKQLIRYDFQDFAYGEHKSVNLYDDIEPIDSLIINQLLFCENIYLKMLDRLEVKIGKRISYSKRKELYLNDLKIQNHILNKHQIKICIIDYIPHLGFDYVLYELCKLKSIKVVMQCYGIPIPFKTVSRYYINDIQNPLPFLSDRVKVEKSKYEPGEHVPLSSRMEEYINHYSNAETS